MSKKEVVKKDDGELVAGGTSSGNFSKGIDSDDLMIPKILLMQAISKLVDAEKAKAGDFVHSLDEDVIGKKEEKPVEFIALGMFKTLQTYENDEYVKTEPLTATNKDLPYSEERNGVTINRTKTMNYYALRTDDIAAMTPFPYVITFKRTSLKGGRKLATKLTMLEDFGAEIYAKTFNLVAKSEEGEKGKYYVMDVTDGRRCTDIEVKVAKKWTERLEATSVTIHETDDEVTSASKESTPEAGNDDIKF